MAADKDGGNAVERVVGAARFIPNHQGYRCHNDNFAARWATIIPLLKY